MKVLLIDDHAMFREGLSLLVAQRFPEVQLLHADSLKRALALLAAQPAIGIVLLDLGLPDSRGMDGLVRLRAALPQGRIVVLSADDTPAVLVANHGPFTWGPDAFKAIEHAEVLEFVARVDIDAGVAVGHRGGGGRLGHGGLGGRGR